MNELEILHATHVEYQGTTDYPSTTSDEYLLMRELANAAINRWENEKGLLWQELFTKLSEASDGDKTTDGTTQADLPTNFKFFNSKYVVTTLNSVDTKWTIIKPQDRQKWEDSGEKYCWITGRVGALKLNFSATPDTGSTIDFEYYKSATKFTTTTSVTEMWDPYFIVYYVSAALNKNDNNNMAWSMNRQDAENKLEEMVVRNSMSAFYQEDNLEDLGAGFGV